jgi:hypothetical protein
MNQQSFLIVATFGDAVVGRDRRQINLSTGTIKGDRPRQTRSAATERADPFTDAAWKALGAFRARFCQPLAPPKGWELPDSGGRMII